jgi:hypothetical protein
MGSEEPAEKSGISGTLQCAGRQIASAHTLTAMWSIVRPTQRPADVGHHDTRRRGCLLLLSSMWAVAAAYVGAAAASPIRAVQFFASSHENHQRQLPSASHMHFAGP